MELLGDDDLEQSSVIANCRMNRERNLTGANGYDRELRFNPLDFLRISTTKGKNARWLDLCCGTGKALAEAAEIVESEGLPIEIVGVDLIEMFAPVKADCLKFVAESVSEWNPTEPFDLITCVHGLHYLGDKLRAIQQAATWLTEHGRFVGNLDMDNIKLQGRSASRIVAAELRRSGFDYSFRKKLIQCEGQKKLSFRFDILVRMSKRGQIIPDSQQWTRTTRTQISLKRETAHRNQWMRWAGIIFKPGEIIDSGGFSLQEK
ncbi:MAG: class I SAM-dependent methyltransferase [Planctomycetaceae bacterium]|nr:class I SAM-dependent methyltransferase [Planctomycetaceae bacterium]